MSYESFEDMKKVNVNQKGRPRSGSPDSVAAHLDVVAAANQAASNIENLDLDSFLATDATPGSDLDKLKNAMRAYKKNQTEENEKKVAEIFDEMIKRGDENVGKTKIPPRKRYVLTQNEDGSFRTVSLGKWRHNQTNPLTKEKNPAFFGGRRKKRKTRKRRRKKRTKKKTRRKRRKSRKRKTKRRRKKKTRKRKAGCWPFCRRRRPRVLEEEPLVQQQQEAPQEAPTVNPGLRRQQNEDDFARLKSSRTRHYQSRYDAREAARAAEQQKKAGTQGGD